MKYKHDCERCIFIKTSTHLGREIDLYYCPGCALSTSYIVRMSDEPSDYLSSHGILAKDSRYAGLREAYEAHQAILKNCN